MQESYEFHEAACWLPLMEDDDLCALADDIRDNGQKHPIELLDGKVIDGRNRLTACRLRGIEPKFIDMKPSDVGNPSAYVASVNVRRRHLSTAQRAKFALKLKEHETKLAEERRKAGAKAGGHARHGSLPEHVPEGTRGEARDKAAAPFGITGKTLFAYEKVAECEPLQQMVDEGKVSTTMAYRVANEPPERRDAIVAQGVDAVNLFAKRKKGNRSRITDDQGNDSRGEKSCKKTDRVPAIQLIVNNLETATSQVGKLTMGVRTLKPSSQECQQARKTCLLELGKAVKYLNAARQSLTPIVVSSRNSDE